MARRKRMARPGCKRRLGDDVSSLHKRIRHVGTMASAKIGIRAFRSETPIDCQAIFLSPLAVWRVQQGVRRPRIRHAGIDTVS